MPVLVLGMVSPYAIKLALHQIDDAGRTAGRLYAISTLGSLAGTFLSADGGSPIVQSALLGGLFVVAALPGCFLWLAFGATLQRVLTNRRRLRAFNVTMGVLLALSIALIVT